jgi:hypothetical protein
MRKTPSSQAEGTAPAGGTLVKRTSEPCVTRWAPAHMASREPEGIHGLVSLQAGDRRPARGRRSGAVTPIEPSASLWRRSASARVRADVAHGGRVAAYIRLPDSATRWQCRSSHRASGCDPVAAGHRVGSGRESKTAAGRPAAVRVATGRRCAPPGQCEQPFGEPVSSAVRKLEPQPQAATAFGLLTVKPAPISVST